MRALMPGAVDIDPIAARQWRRRPPPHSADRAGHRHHENKTSDRAAPAAPAARTAPCSPRELTTRLRLARAYAVQLIQTGALCAARSTRGAGAPPGRLARAEIPSEYAQRSHFSTDPSKRACCSRAGIQSE